MFENFDFDLLSNSEFKEDFVREELVLPIIKFLGYKPTGDSRVIRSKNLRHMFVSIGSKKNKISIIPDYVFLDNSKAYWVLDAKAPWEDVTKSSHVEQAYSYAIHPEIRAELFALCNGKEFALYSVRRAEPLLHFKLSDIDEYLDVLYRLLNASDNKGNPNLLEYLPDYGLIMIMSGIADGFKYVALSVSSNFIGKRADNEYIFAATIPGDIDTTISFVFDDERLKQLLDLIPDYLSAEISDELSRSPFHISLNENFRIGISSTISNKISNNEEESWVDFVVDEFMIDALSQLGIDETELQA
jgi:hypothetical protein